MVKRDTDPESDPNEMSVGMSNRGNTRCKSLPRRFGVRVGAEVGVVVKLGPDPIPRQALRIRLERVAPRLTLQHHLPVLSSHANPELCDRL